MTKTLLDLLKACINATLLLLALSLFLGWKLMSSVDNVTGQVTQAVAQITPVQNRIEALRTEVVALRSDILQRPEIAVSAKLDAMDRRLAALQSEMLDLKTLPAEVIRDAAQTGAAEFAGQIARLSNCVPPTP
ncbi:hypothetical protein [Parasedimentitalea huanghaiensis]|uniref:Uncharacterized protein n=1 Tax=Parasedimentitalea huanghaiensis TaxID=2682100 RepID=A0A6L6WBX3_9RHOB|nr:hypothetical protein [Zongyanglinia huanghaiensis]MVO14711.1 hypothetical protein [Zongyanglinia huanghaiensis]